MIHWSASALLMMAAAILVVGPGRSHWMARVMPALHQVTPAGLGALGRLRPRAQRDRSSPELSLALELLACALRAGQPPSMAAAAVAHAVRGPIADTLLAVARAAELGAAADIAWQPLGRLTSAATVARAAARAAESGTRLADELAQIAADVRVRQAAASDARVRRAGVLVVLPLGLCFLPAFVLIGVVPIVIGIAGSALN